MGRIISGRYFIERVIGEGGMGAVYQAEHTHMHKRLAVKVLHPEMSRLPEVVARFEREAMAAAHIEHPNVAAATMHAIPIGRNRSLMDAFGPSQVHATKASPIAAGAFIAAAHEQKNSAHTGCFLTASAMPAQYRKGRVISATAPANSHNPVTKITCGANGTQSGVILRSSAGAARCAMPPAAKNAARIQRMMARAVAKRMSEAPAGVKLCMHPPRYADFAKTMTVATNRTTNSAGNAKASPSAVRGARLR